MSNEPIINKKSVWTDTRGSPNILILNQQQSESSGQDKLRTSCHFIRSEGRSDTTLLNVKNPWRLISMRTIKDPTYNIYSRGGV